MFSAFNSQAQAMPKGSSLVSSSVAPSFKALLVSSLVLGSQASQVVAMPNSFLSSFSHLSVSLIPLLALSSQVSANALPKEIAEALSAKQNLVYERYGCVAQGCYCRTNYEAARADNLDPDACTLLLLNPAKRCPDTVAALGRRGLNGINISGEEVMLDEEIHLERRSTVTFSIVRGQNDFCFVTSADASSFPGLENTSVTISGFNNQTPCGNSKGLKKCKVSGNIVAGTKYHNVAYACYDESLLTPDPSGNGASYSLCTLAKPGLMNINPATQSMFDPVFLGSNGIFAQALGNARAFRPCFETSANQPAFASIGSALNLFV